MIEGLKNLKIPKYSPKRQGSVNIYDASSIGKKERGFSNPRGGLESPPSVILTQEKKYEQQTPEHIIRDV